MSEKNFTQCDVEYKQLKEENEKLRNENDENENDNENENENKNENENENEQFFKNNIVKDANIKELIEEPKEIKSPNWIDKNKFKEILAIIDSNKFNYRNKIGEFKYIGIRDLVNNIRNTTVSKIDAEKDLNTFSKIKNAEMIKHKRRTSKHKELLNLFNDLSNTILTDKTLMSSKDKERKRKMEITKH